MGGGAEQVLAHARLQDHTRSTAKRYVMVNIPGAQVEAVEGNQVVSRHSGVVGKQDRPSPILRTQIHEINFNPTWTLPPTVIEKDLVPKGRDEGGGGLNEWVRRHDEYPD